MLADLGAEVIKIENPNGGDDARTYRPPEAGGEGAYYLSLNRNKKSIALDMRTDAARAVARDLIDGADVVLENFSTGVMDRFGLSFETVSKTNPGLIYCAISSYGRSGPFTGRAGYDPVVQAESGFLSLTGEPGGEGVRTGIAMIDVTTGMMATKAILAALFVRERKGKACGQFIEVPLFDTGVAMTLQHGLGYLIDGTIPARMGNGSIAAEPIGAFQASDGPFQLAAAGVRVSQKLVMDVLGRPDLAENPAFSDNAARCANRVELRQVLNAIFVTDTRDNWMAKMREKAVPAGPIRDIGQAMDSPEVAARELVEHIPHPTAGTVPNIKNPMRFSKTPVVPTVAAPLLGQQTREILTEVLGYDDTQIEALRAQGSIPDDDR
jgi:crotonobetainyl-CoA:carnitine CoA-transferase CaiB-like acyl-CoA transferase